MAFVVQFSLYFLFISLFSVDYLHYRLDLVPQFVTWMPEVISLWIVLLMIVQFVVHKRIKISIKYLVLLFFFVILVLVGIIANQVQPGSIFIGLRVYFRYLPVFFLPAVYDFSERQVRNQLYFVTGLCLLQAPIAAYQRLVTYRGILTGDVITGTLYLSGTLSMVLLSAIALVIAFRLKNLVSLKTAFILSLLLFIPTTLNETKATVILLPVVFLVPVLLESGLGFLSKTKQLILVTAGCLIFIVIFVPIYNHFMVARAGMGLTDYLEAEISDRGYFYTGADLNDDKVLGRADVLILTLKSISDDATTFIFGSGIGNAMRTSLSSIKRSNQTLLQERSQGYTITYFLWELGVSGFLVFLFLHLAVLADAWRIKGGQGLFSALALGWLAVVIVMLFGMIYTNILRVSTLNIMFWYFSGIIASHKIAVEHA